MLLKVLWSLAQALVSAMSGEEQGSLRGRRGSLALFLFTHFISSFWKMQNLLRAEFHTQGFSLFTKFGKWELADLWKSC